MVTFTDRIVLIKLCCTNVAATDSAAFIATVQPPLPLQAPLQLLKAQPRWASASKSPAIRR